ncbi:fimbrillin family protein [Bacteroides finegoldii]|uniref:fimbrillin family protein n=1 Tax=Bacteroides finegoldii TaxID=338188 RepID=UPI00189E52DC|nr:fimbrillin family protein [Bacteroides finegoldii]
MKSIFKLSAMLLAATFMVSCSQDEESEVISSEQDNTLTVAVTANDFQSDAPETRITEDNYVTTFTADKDKIGIYAISVDEDRKVHIQNVPLTMKADGNWQGSKPVYYYKNADYIAYYPYTEELDAVSVTSEKDIVTYFAAKLTNEQSTKDAYVNADLMSAKIESVNVSPKGTLNFAFTHQFSMIEVTIPIRSYKTGDKVDAYEYSAPLKIELSVNGIEYMPYAIAKGTYRCIVTPTAAEKVIGLEGVFYDGETPVVFAKSGFTLASNNYKKLNVIYTYENYNPIRSLEVGDYYYADGSIYPKELSNPPLSGCIGLIFSTSTSNADRAVGWKNGYVMALNDTDEDATTTIDTKDLNKGYTWGVNTDVFTGLTSFTASNNAECEALLTHMDGLSDTQAILSFITEKGTAVSEYSQVLQQIEQYTVAVPTPEGLTSGWYVPSMGQLAAIINNLGVTTDDPAKSFNKNNCTFFDQNNGALEAMSHLSKVLKTAGGLFYHKPLPTDGNWYGYRWWTSTASGKVSNMWAIDMNNGKYLLYDCDKSTTWAMHIRPVLAF